MPLKISRCSLKSCWNCLRAAPRAGRQPLRAGGPPLPPPRPRRRRRPLHGDSNIHRLSFRGGEPLHHDVVGPRREGPANPLAALVRPVNLQLGAFEIDRAEIVLDRRGFGILQTHRECRAPPPNPPPARWGSCAIRRSRVCAASWYFPSSSICRTCGKMPAMLGASNGLLCGSEQAFVAEDDLLRVGIAGRLDTHRPVAGDEKRIAGGRDAAKAAPRHDLPPDPFRQRHRRDPRLRRRSIPRSSRRLRQILVLLRAPKVIGGANLLCADGAFAADRVSSAAKPSPVSAAIRPGRRRRAFRKKISALHRILLRKILTGTGGIKLFERDGVLPARLRARTRQMPSDSVAWTDCARRTESWRCAGRCGAAA